MPCDSLSMQNDSQCFGFASVQPGLISGEEGEEKKIKVAEFCCMSAGQEAVITGLKGILSTRP